MSWRKCLAVLSPVVLMSALAAAVAISATAETANADQITVNIRDFSFNPATLTIQVGDVVRWENTGAMSHTTSSLTGAWDSGTLAPGGAFSQQFLTPGTFNYVCRIHPSMQASITVQGPPATATPVPPTAAPAATAVPPTAVPAQPTPVPTTVVVVPPPVIITPPAPPELWFVVREETPAYSLTDEIIWYAAPGEWYKVFDQDGVWLLSMWEFDSPDNVVWIQLDARIDLGFY